MWYLLIVLLTLFFSFTLYQDSCGVVTGHYGEKLQDYTDILQQLIDKASESDDPVLMLKPGRFGIRGKDAVVLKPGVSLHGSEDEPTIFSTLNNDDDEDDGEDDHHHNATATIQVPAASVGWTIDGIIFDNVNIDVQPQQNHQVAKIANNVFLNGGRGSIQSSFGANLLIDSNIFLRDHAHAGKEFIPQYNTTNTGVLFQTQENSMISNNIFGMDLRHLDDLMPVVSSELQSGLTKIKYALTCLQAKWDDQQGFLMSGVQLYSSNEITIQNNILNGTFPDTMPIPQDHAISIVGSNQTYILQNFVAGWQLADFGGAFRFTSAVDSYVVSNYLANTAVMIYVANHADFQQIDNMVVYDNFFFHFLGKEFDPPAPLAGWLYEGITFYDFWTARLNNTIRPPFWNSSAPLSPFAHNIIISDNHFASAKGIDPNVISLGNLEPTQAHVDKKNCYVTEPLLNDTNRVPLLWRQQYQKDTFARYGNKIPVRSPFSTDRHLIKYVPEDLQDLEIPDFWKAFTLRNNTVPMIPPETECY
ncbi:uncharacterized protein BX664DRAFT_335414 [Halteromyces radiatus]|uniref:uncharacterized protein n=1 Tax=Halteromyces radiatus TaxID=101107 RepID=UPI0022209D77|nr:uncharacterized protein BX664DRAFT_335414 [Halteromyces radiatus]KAI8086281.1 hypothetical protein BX664DRAFT_335414 [Halteromyces radiatus]